MERLNDDIQTLRNRIEELAAVKRILATQDGALLLAVRNARTFRAVLERLAQGGHGLLRLRIGKLEIQVVTDAHDHQALPLLSHAEVGGVEYPFLGAIAQRLQHVEDGGERAAMVVGS